MWCGALGLTNYRVELQLLPWFLAACSTNVVTPPLPSPGESRKQ
jgi:hypothetical protein